MDKWLRPEKPSYILTARNAHYCFIYRGIEVVTQEIKVPHVARCFKSVGISGNESIGKYLCIHMELLYN